MHPRLAGQRRCGDMVTVQRMSEPTDTQRPGQAVPPPASDVPGSALPGVGVDGLAVRLDGGVLWVTLDRPEQRNSLTWAMISGLRSIVEQVRALGSSLDDAREGTMAFLEKRAPNWSGT